MKRYLGLAIIALLAVCAVSTAQAQRLVAVKSYYPSYSKDNLGNMQVITNQHFACFAQFYNDYSYVILEGNKYKFKETRNSDHYYYPVSAGYKELIFSSNFQQMTYLFLDFAVMGMRSTTYIFFNYLGEGQQLAENYKQTQMNSLNGYGGGGYGGGSYGGGNYGNQHAKRYVKCGLCFGDGKCLKCSGRGVHTNPYTGKYITCSYCNGTGRCHHCHGSGECTCNRQHHPNTCNMVNYRNQYM